MNKSGISPSGDRILVKPDNLEEVTAGGIIIPEVERQKYQAAQALGVVVEIGPDAYTHHMERVYKVHKNGERELVEERVTGYSKPFAEPGERVMFARFGGLPTLGEDGEQYRLLNDEDITARVSPHVELTELRSREPMGTARRARND